MRRRSAIAVTAARMASIVAWGFDAVETRDPSTSAIIAPARAAMWRWVSGGTTRSAVPTTAQLGRVFQAAVPDGVVLALSVMGRAFHDQPAISL